MSAEKDELKERFRAGFMEGLREVYDELMTMHHDPKGYDRKVIDELWARVRRIEIKFRNQVENHEKTGA